MPLTLAIDCAMRWLNLGLTDGGTPIAEENASVGNRQSECLPTSVNSFLLRQGASLADIRQIAVTIGPGYYTGIRVGMSYAAALAESLEIRLVPVTTLHVIAFDALSLLESGHIVVPVLKARRSAIYGAIYDNAESRFPATPRFDEADEFVRALESLAHPKDRVLIVGSDALLFPALMGSGYPILPVIPTMGLALARAAQKIPSIDPAALAAMYLRAPD